MKNCDNSKPESLWFTIIRLLRWHKPEGRLILMIPALWAVFLAASGKPPLFLVVIIVLGTLATSAVGCVVNDLWDRNIDAEVVRTRSRPLASRTLSIKVGIVVAVVSLMCAASLSFYLNSLSFWLSVAAVPVILLYPGAKRVFALPQLVLSIAWGFAVLISWSAVTQNLSQPSWLLWGATILWTLGFDTVYAMSDREDDRRIGVNSSALFFGSYASTAVGIFFFGTVVLLAWLGVLINLTFAFWVSLVMATIGWSWQYLRLRKQDLPNHEYNGIFCENVWIGFVLLAGMIAGSV
ncbi:4-hydroxybenzoate solanesyltransferase [Umezakia ovalisporum]|jgi:4-hydroxybenzoate polyprenyltransferase|uniref:4-hydroxybenzoate solanesyltransferase n=2 Tax=Umezakia ovalisporum TaxID=75695 RepID=A0AA43KDH7_9CYAN|nr:4-hydroxybenzoate solanesyltransferase [Umezakia ovalisporum]MBI1243156.1 4-hydroxybenzoate octaprenyltransferase [Nostoc sp. RI_552]MDH6055373.1 4-hydroxybenzoate solanesyltransferase [Umezakia ovalisporum FSS-43]MDH6062546.1 4-hydroxybenzoate solanesyltransferase [Umezakia ovalisporum FSS-62]MDH6068020.1 4-hydroxybenzoate solanesyltransferase [Umezakia ovalisporum APH033B]MDH6069943.1 4-hydroxybenzoate solanesyltransferase [Umezakia ovalisporum CobakiLakeA]